MVQRTLLAEASLSGLRTKMTSINGCRIPPAEAGGCFNFNLQQERLGWFVKSPQRLLGDVSIAASLVSYG